MPPPSPPTPLAPLPPLPPDFVAASSESELRTLIEEASAGISIFLAPGAHLKLSSQIECSSNIEVTVASSGKRAMLDGQGRTRLFRLSGRCSLTLQGLALINGKAASGGVLYAFRAGDIRIIDSTVTACAATYYGGLVDARSSRSISLIDSNVTNCSAGYDGGVVYARSAGAVSLIRSTAVDCIAGAWGGGIFTEEANLEVAHSTISGCRAERGGAVYVEAGTARIASSIIFNCSASRSGGGLYSAGGRTTLTDRTLIHGCAAYGVYNSGSIHLVAGEVEYVLPAPAGRWLQAARCEIYRQACPRNQSEAQKEQCLANRNKCALALIDEDLIGKPPLYCQEPNPRFRPCNWKSSNGGDPSLLGKSLYYLPMATVGQDFPFACGAGLNSSADPQDQSSNACAGPCPVGTSSAEGTGVCLDCKPGTYAANQGQGECSRCPHPVTSKHGSASCSICLEGYYLQDSTADPADIFRYPAEHCRRCTPNADCSMPSTTLESLGVDRGFWRATIATARLYTCDESDTCIGSTSETPAGRALASSGEKRGAYCADGHTGPLCQVCTENGRYFSLADRHCVDCPGEWRLAVIAVAVALGAGIVTAAVMLLRSTWEPERKCLARLLKRARSHAELAKKTGLWTKLKISISLYQCLAAIPSVYMLTVPDSLVGSAIDDLQRGLTAAFRFADLAVPSECYGTAIQKLIGAAFTPYALFLLLAVEQAIQIAIAARLKGRSQENGPIALAASGLRSALPTGLFLSFFIQPRRGPTCHSRPRQRAGIPPRICRRT